MKAIILDTETTGLLQSGLLPLKSQPQIIEMYMARVDLTSGAIEAEFDSFFKPDNPVTEEITKITGITQQLVDAAPRFVEYAKDIETFIYSAPLVIAHNMSYDKEIIDIEFKRLGTELDWPRCLCTVEQTIDVKGFRLSLLALHEYLFGEGFVGAHRAKIDTQALIRCCVELYKRDMI